MTKKEFAETVKKALLQAGCHGPLVYSTAPFYLYDVNDGTNRFYLDNAYQAVTKAPSEEKEAVLHSFINTWLSKPSIPKEFDVARTNVWPILRTSAEFSITSREVSVDTGIEYEVVHRELGDTGLAIGLGYDTPNALLFIGRNILDDWKIELDEAIKAAKNNLVNSLSGKYNFTAIGKLYQAMDTGPYGDAIVLSPDVLNSLEFDGAPVVMVPTRNQLLIADSADNASLSLMVEIVKKSLASQSGQFCSATAIQLEENKWKKFNLPDGHELKNEFDFLSKREQSHFYGRQKEVLKKAGCSSGVATFELFLNPENEPVSMATWSNGVDTLLPVTDLVCLVHSPLDPNTKVTLAKWRDMQIACAKLLTVSNHIPIRFRTRGFPSPEILERIQMVMPQ